MLLTKEESMTRTNFSFFCLTLLVASISFSTAKAAETWKLEDSTNLRPLTDSEQDRFTKAVTQIKQMVNEGETSKVKKALKQLKIDFPKFSGPDVDAFIKAETLFSKGNITRARKEYDSFITN